MEEMRRIGEPELLDIAYGLTEGWREAAEFVLGRRPLSKLPPKIRKDLQDALAAQGVTTPLRHWSPGWGDGGCWEVPHRNRK